MLLALPLAAKAEPLRRVLFIGNSFTHEHDVPALVATLAAQARRPIEPHVVVRNGARLAGHLRREIVRQTLTWGWEAVVLQDHSTEALHPARLSETESALALADRLSGEAALVLFTPWPRAAGHPLYARLAGVSGRLAPETPAEMARLTTAQAKALAARQGATVAPVASAWAAALEEGQSLHTVDGYHANPAGAALSARVLWETLAKVLP
ncbi:MAG: hypothetical protein AAGI34_07860 [Pseudomonadota bacterium]